MKIEITEEMREALRRWAIYRASHAELKNPTPGQDLALDEEAHRIARLVAEAVERAEKDTAPEDSLCAFGSDECPCLEPDVDHVFIHMKRTQLECHACGAREDIPLPGKPAVLQAMVDQHEGCERRGGGDA